jgi:hypothetical protein
LSSAEHADLDGEIQRGSVSAGRISGEAHPVKMKCLIGSATVASGSTESQHRTQWETSVPTSHLEPALRRRLASSSGHPRWL